LTVTGHERVGLARVGFTRYGVGDWVGVRSALISLGGTESVDVAVAILAVALGVEV
jgi:hypothetical protein